MANKESSEAAKKIAKAEKETKAKKPKKNKKNVFKAIARFFKDLKGEIKKITWPGAKDVLKGTVVTIVCIAVIGIAVCLVDLGLTEGINALRTVAENRATTTVAETTTAAAVAESATTTTTTTATTTTTTTAAAE